MKNKAILGGLALFLLAGCVTPYAPMTFIGGFDEKQLSWNEFAVGFSGNGYTTGQRATDLCMLRCAEITLGHGFHYFVLTGNSLGYDNSTSLTTANYFSTGYGNGFMLSSTQTIPKPSAVNRIICFRQLPSAFTDYYDAQNVYDELSQKYGIQKSVEEFPEFRLPVATIGIEENNLTVYHPNLAPAGAHGPVVMGERKEFQIQFLEENNPAKMAGVRIGDKILALDGVAITNVAEIAAIEATWNVGQVVQVKIGRSGNVTTVPVETVFNPVLRFKKEHDVKIAEPVSEHDVTVVEDQHPKAAMCIIASYGNLECPVASDSELKRYLIQAAVYNSANCVLILNSPEAVREMYPNADARLGFECALAIVPKACLGVEFETGQGYENRRVIRRLLSQEANDGGLEIGDNILAINGIDPVLQTEDYLKDFMTWNVGQKIPVTVARNGKQMNLTVQASANRL